MTEEDWLTCCDPFRMMASLTAMGAFDFRKKALFAVACCRRLWELLPSKSRDALIVLEKYADRDSDEDLLTAATESALEAAQYALDDERTYLACWAVRFATAIGIWDRGIEHSNFETTFSQCAHSLGSPGLLKALWGLSPDDERRPHLLNQFNAGIAAQNQIQADLLRHIMGNPFGSNSYPRRWPSHVRDLAKRLYSYGDCDFALRDSLIDMAQDELADHFADGALHPKGCWALDLILMRTNEPAG